MASQSVDDAIEEVTYRLGVLEEEVRATRRAAQTTRSIAIALMIIYVGIPLVLFFMGLVFNVSQVAGL